MELKFNYIFHLGSIQDEKFKRRKNSSINGWLFAKFSFKNSFIQMKNIQNGNQQSSLSHKKKSIENLII